jgi:hypothetical protein
MTGFEPKEVPFATAQAQAQVIDNRHSVKY